MVRVSGTRGMVILYDPHVELVKLLRFEFSVVAGSRALRGSHRPEGPLRPGRNPTHQLCDQSPRVPLPDRGILLFTLVRVLASTNLP